MSSLGKIADAVDAYDSHVAAEVARARTDKKFAADLQARWEKIRVGIETTHSPTGTPLPRLALPQTDEPGAIAEYLLGQGLPGEFPYANAAYREMYLDREVGRVNLPAEASREGRVPNAPVGAKPENQARRVKDNPPYPVNEEPMRLFAGLGLAEDTNERFHYLGKHQKSLRLSTAFDGPTLYGLDSDHEGVLGKVGEGGVAIDTVEDMTRLFAGFDLTHTSIYSELDTPTLARIAAHRVARVAAKAAAAR